MAQVGLDPTVREDDTAASGEARRATAEIQMKSHHDKIRQCLRDHPDGRTATEIAECAGIAINSLWKSFDTCFGVYIDRWEGPFRGQWRAVYCLADVPENCPRPA